MNTQDYINTLIAIPLYLILDYIVLYRIYDRYIERREWERISHENKLFWLKFDKHADAAIKACLEP